MSIKLQVTEIARASLLPGIKRGKVSPLRLGLLVAAVLVLPGLTMAQNPPAPSPKSSPQPAATPLPPNAAGSTVRPDNEAQQSTQPQTGPQQERQQTTPDTQGPRPPTPQTPGQPSPSTGLPTTTTPAGTAAPQPSTSGAPAGGNPQPGAQQTPGQNVGTSSGVAPAELPQEPPPVAPGYEAPPRPLPSAERVGVDASDVTPLSLREAITLALENNNDIDASRIDVEMAEFDLKGARGVYDPLISSESYFERRVTPVSSIIGGGTNGSVIQKDATGSLRLGGFTPFAGGSYQLDFSSTRLNTNNQFVSINPQFPTALTLTYAQPLLRGLRIDDNRRRIEIAKKNLSLSDAQFRQRAIEVIARVEQSYWDLVFALRNLQVQIDAVKQARTQVESNQRQVDQGILAPIDVVAAENQVTTFEQNVYTAQEAVTRAENNLKTMLLPDRSAPLWSRALLPVTPVTVEAPRVPLEQAVSSALANRPEIAELKTTAEINQVNTRYFRDQTKPQLDLVGTYNVVGLAGNLVSSGPNPLTSGNVVLQARVNELSALAGLPPLPPPAAVGSVSPDLIGGYGQSLSNLFGQNYPTYRAGVRLSLPLRNRTAEANLGRSLAEGRRVQNQRAQFEQLIEAEVRNATQAVRSAEAKLAAAAATRSSAEQQYASEQRKFQAGRSTVFLVLERQTNLITARGRELQAQTDLNKSIADFQRATGNTLQSNNVSVRTDTPTRQLQIVPPASNGLASDSTGAESKARIRP
jgi:outer membrane protein